MGYFKKYISQILCVFILFGVLTSSFAFASEETYNQTEITSFNENIDLMKKLGILDNKEKPQISYLVTRAEFAKILLRTMGNENLASNYPYEATFTDVTEETPYYSYVLWANKVGYLKGVGNDKFAPNEYITTEQVIKCFVNILGYGSLAEQKGGYPSGYINQATGLGLLENIELQNGYPITYYNLTKIIYNSLDIDFMIKASVTDEEYEISENSNILSTVFSLEKYKGIITGTEKTHLIKNETLSGNQIEIDNKVYTVSENYNDLIGRKVDFYVYTKEKNEIKFVCQREKYNTILSIDAIDIEDYKNQTYYYIKDNKEDKIYEEKIADAYVIYNGKALSSGNESDFFPKSGDITFIDNNNDGKKDVVLITNYRTVVVNDVDVEKKVIGDKIDSANPISVKDSWFLSIKDTKNKELALNKISKNDILSVAASKDQSIINIIVSKDSVTGIVDSFEKASGSDFETITVDGKKYKVNNASFESDDNILGLKCRIGFDIYGRAASLRKSNVSNNYVGYLINAAYKGDFATIRFKIFDTESDEVKTFAGAEKIKIDKELYKDNDSIIDALKKFKIGATDEEKENTLVLSQLILFTLNENDEIVEIDTPYNHRTDSINDYQQIPVPNNESEDSLRVIYHGSGALQFKTSSKIFGGKVPITGSTKILRVPNDPKDADEKVFMQLSASYFSNDESYTVEAYSNSSNSMIADILLVYENSSAGASGQNVGLIQSISEVVDSEGLIVKKLVILNSYRTYTVYAYDVDIDNVPPMVGEGTYKLAEGDTVRFNSDSLHRLGYIRLLYDASSDGDEAIKFTNPSGGYTGYHRYLFGNIYSKEDNVIAVTRKSKADMEAGLKAEDYELYSTTYFAIIEYDRARGSVSAKRVSASAIKDFKNYGDRFSKVFIHTSHCEGYEIIIYK